jgi:uncharacterized protein (TIGR02271 family)
MTTRGKGMEGSTDFNQQPGSDKDLVENQLTGQSITIPVIEENIKIDKEVIETGSIRISKNVHNESVTVDVPLMHEEHTIERIPVNEYLETPPPPVRYEGDTMIIPVLREELVVQKRIVLVEELRITKLQVETNEPQQVILRKEEVSVDRIATDKTVTSNEVNDKATGNPDADQSFTNSI